MILHLVHDEKIINRTIDVFNSVYPGENIFVVFTKKKFKLVNKTDCVLTVDEFARNYSQIDYSSVVIHYLSSDKIKFVHKYFTISTPVYWIVWGAELYNNMLAYYGFKLYDKESSYFKRPKLPLLKKVKRYIKERSKAARFRKFIFKRVNFMVSDVEGDFEKLVEHLPEMSSKIRKDFIYYPVDTILGKDLIDKSVEGNNIQIGNSASLSNNHEYVMRHLKGLQLGDRSVYVPLSYAGNDENTACVIRTGKELFGSNFKPMTEFLPLGEYTNLMVSFGVALYGNWRQEAVGNILISLYLGAKVFLPACNPVLEWARRRNLIVFELEKITQEELDQPLTDELRQRNREIILSLYNNERMSSLIRELGLRE